MEAEGCQARSKMSSAISTLQMWYLVEKEGITTELQYSNIHPVSVQELV